VERERRHAEPSQPVGRVENVVQRCHERDVEGERDRRRPGGPQPQHCLACGSDPEEGGAEFRFAQGQLETDDVAVEGDRAVEVAHGQVRLEEPFDGDRFAHGAIE
jgi:hypothetical protein